MLENLIVLSDRTVAHLHITGGGSQNALLCQITADAVGRTAVAGPAEAMALGNAIAQYIALGGLGSVAQARKLLSRAAGTTIYQPHNTAAWDEHCERF